MGRVSEPEIYSGFVISMIGQQAGQRIPMQYKIAQANVAVGTARWEDDESDLDKGIAGEIARREQEREDQAQVAKAAYDASKAPSPPSIEAVLWGKARPVSFYVDSETKTVYLARPFPPVVAATEELVSNETVSEVTREGDQVVMIASNATARYNITAEKDGLLLLELESSTGPEVLIPADWRERSHLVNIPLAKRIRATSESMTKVEAEAIIEEWTKDDIVSTENQSGDADDGADKGAGSTARVDGHDLNEEQRRNRDEAAQRAQEKADAFLHGDEGNDGFGG